MADILYAWEFGAGLGHMGAFLPLAEQLRANGHIVHWAVTQPASAARLLPQRDFTWLQAPQIAEQVRTGPPLSYADILLRFGYASKHDLHGLVVAWRQLILLTGARLVLADHAPTAVLAARTLGLPVMLFSNGFTVPPRRTPLPAMRDWLPPPPNLQAIDNVARDSINAVLAIYGKPPLSATAELFDVAEETMVTFPELDHYPDRGPARYWGSLPSAGGGSPLHWPNAATDQPRLFAYLRTESPHHEALLATLVALGAPTIIYFPGISPVLQARHSAPHILYMDAPADIEQACRDAHVGITYASLATTTAFLLAGKPLLLLPWHLEQFMLARRVEAMGAGILINPEQPPGNLTLPIQALIAEPRWRQNAEGFATKYRAFDQSKVLDNLCRRAEELMNGA